MAFTHVPVLIQEAVGYLDCRPGKVIVDATLGGAGHARRICSLIGPEGMLIGLDQDPAAVANAREVLAPFSERIHLFQRNFADLAQVLAAVACRTVDGILLDLGLSFYQLDQSGRGFSFQKDEPLDMRMDPRTTTTAADLVNDLGEKDLVGLLRRFGEEPHARAIARRIVAGRRQGPLTTSGQLARLVAAAVPAGARGRIHPATRVFMALRIAVNRELEVLERFFDDAIGLLNPGGRICAIAFHSLEDRIVKRRFQALAKGCTCPPDLPRCNCGRQPVVRIVTAKAVKPTAEEIAANPMARSARLRVAQKLPAPAAGPVGRGR